MARPPRWSERGQASLEWVALVAVVGAVLAAAAAATVAGAPGIVNAIGGALQRALCRAGGGDCRPIEPKACVVTSSDSSTRAGVKLSFLKIGGRIGLLRELRSDRTVRLTLVHEGEAGATAGAGARAEIELAGLLDARAGAMTEAEIVARLGVRRSWDMRAGPEADALTRRIIRRVAEDTARGVSVLRPAIDVASRVIGYDFTELPEPDEASIGGDLEARTSLEADLGAEASLGLRTALGATRSRDGVDKVVFTIAAEASVDLQRALLGLHAEGLGSVAVAMSFRNGRSTELEVSALGDGDAQVALPDGAPLGQALRTERGGRVEARGTLDLTEADHAAAARRLLAALAPGRASALAAASADLAGRLTSGGTLTFERRSTSRDAYGAGVLAGMGAELGVQVEASRVASRLEDAWWRPRGGLWDRRVDCVGSRA